MRKWFAERKAIFLAAIENRLARILLGVWASLGIWDLAVSQFVPRSWSSKIPNLVAVVDAMSGLLPWWGWVIIGLLILLYFAIEFAIRQNRRQQSRDAQAATGEVEPTVPYDQWRNLDEIDLPTAAAIWAGTRDDNDVVRHLRFRQLKQAVQEGRLESFRRANGKINRFTTVKPNELARFFAIRSADDARNTYVDFRLKDFIIEGNNISSITDNGTGDFTINFSEPFSSDRISVTPLAGTPSSFEIKGNSPSSVRILFSAPEPDRIALKFDEVS